MPVHVATREKTLPGIPKEWTVLIFMVLDGTIEDMKTTADNDLKEMRKAGSTPDRNVIVQKHVLSSRFSIGPRPNSANRAAITPFDVDLDDSFGAVPTLKQFLLDSLEEFPAEHFALILWGHSFELGFGGLSSPGNTLDLTELADALGAFKRNRPGCRALDILGTSSCSYSTTEAVVGLSGLVDLLVASEGTIPFTTGWPFEGVLERFNRGNAPEEVCTDIVRQFVSSTPRAPVSLTAVDVRESTVLFQMVSDLAEAILEGASDIVFRQSILIAFLEAITHLLPSPSDNSKQGWVPAVDIIDFAHELSKDTIVATAADVARTVRTAARNGMKAMEAKRVVFANETSIRNGSMNGLLLLAPGTGRRILKIIEQQQLGSEKLIGLLDDYARFEESFLERNQPRYPENWKQTKWPQVLKLITESLDAMLEATPQTDAGKRWCTARDNAGRKAMIVLGSEGLPT